MLAGKNPTARLDSKRPFKVVELELTEDKRDAMGSLPASVLNLMNFAHNEGSASLPYSLKDTPKKSIIVKIIQDGNALPQSLESWHSSARPGSPTGFSQEDMCLPLPACQDFTSSKN